MNSAKLQNMKSTHKILAFLHIRAMNELKENQEKSIYNIIKEF